MTDHSNQAAVTEIAAKPVEATTASTTTHKPVKSHLLRIIGGIVFLIILIAGIVWFLNNLNIVSTDDAYVNGHVTFVAPRVPGQVIRVLVDDNNRVHKGDLLVQLDKEPYQVQVNIAQAAVAAAQSDLV